MATTIIDQAENVSRLHRKAPLCPKCKVALGYRVRRGFLFKQLLSWLPLKRYFCYKCGRKHYVWN